MDKGLEQKLEVLSTISMEYSFLWRASGFPKSSRRFRRRHCISHISKQGALEPTGIASLEFWCMWTNLHIVPDFVSISIRSVIVCQIALFLRELHRFTQNTLNPDSSFHVSHTQSEDFTDATVYPSPSDPPSGPQLKKRKRDLNGADPTSTSLSIPSATNDSQFARLPSHMLANKHMSQHVHQIVKRECEQLVTMVVRIEGAWSSPSVNLRRV
jgi:hypothetical protein